MTHKRSIEGFFLALVFWLISAVAIVFGAKRWLPPLASEHGAGVDHLSHFCREQLGPGAVPVCS